MTIETLSVLLLSAAVPLTSLAHYQVSPPATQAPKSGHDEEDEDDEKEERTSLADLPPAVRETIERVAGRHAIREVEKVTRGGVTTYGAEYRADGVEHSVEVSATGEVLRLKQDVPPGGLPPEVQAAVRRRLPGGVIREAEAVRAGAATAPTHYEVEVRDGGRKHKLKVRPSGEIVEKSR